jgi:hypothetical protein
MDLEPRLPCPAQIFPLKRHLVAETQIKVKKLKSEDIQNLKSDS